jgi:hypothetical protein
LAFNYDVGKQPIIQQWIKSWKNLILLKEKDL